MEKLLTGLDPVLLFGVVFLIALVALVIGYVVTVRYGKTPEGKDDAAFGLAQAAIFGLIALIFGFSFAFATSRFEARRELIVKEAISIGGTYHRSDYLPAVQRTAFRTIVVNYAKNRLSAYESTDENKEAAFVERAKVLKDQLWQIAAGTMRTDTTNIAYLDLASSVRETIALGQAQDAALLEHMPILIMGLLVFCTIVASALRGIAYGRSRIPHPAQSVIWCILLAAVVFTAIDLDTPRVGFTKLNLEPLRTTVDSIVPSRQ